ncbi:MYCBP-associated protein [Asbolus verrucosus]|uniref:MYCBP-associated protein n=1 Tax=Asbolus verrucosus TaxID=1661398 RepID=A0A482VM52_ASBVE|nr:MYCBP-associated protein [Asbolus verrucosus]
MSGDRNKDANEICRKETEAEEDTRLKNWSAWLKKWKNIEGRISEKIEKSPEQLLMRYADSVNNVNEEKLMLQYAKIPTEFDKYRGNPDFWKLPLSLPRRYEHCSQEPDYFAVRTEEERNIAPILELTGTPEYIQNEKNILYGARNIYKKWQDSAYRNEQLKKCASKIKSIVPHKPKFEQLIVVGRKMLSDVPDTVHNDEEITEEGTEHIQLLKVDKSRESLKQAKPSRLSLKINGIDLDPSKNEERGSRKLRINFDYDVSAGMVGVDYLFFENNGLTTLRISWNKLKKFRIFRNYTEEKWDKHGFYFDKNELLILPGQSIDFPIWFKTENAGTYSESWELTTNPKFWDDDSKVILILHSYAYFKNMKEKVDEIVKYIDIQERNILIKDILREIVEQVKYGEIPVAPCVFEEAQLFEIANLVNGRPLFSFDEIVVDELKLFYDRIKTEMKNWNYSVKQLTKLAQEKDIATYQENKKMDLIKKITQMQSSKLFEETDLQGKSPSKTKKEKSSTKISKSKDKSSKILKGEKSRSKTSQKSNTDVEASPKIKNEDYIYTNQSELWDLVKKLDSPVVINSEREKYFQCTRVMTAYFNKMCQLLESLEKEKGIQKISSYPPLKYKLTAITQQPERLVYEYFEDHYVPNRVLETDPFEAKPKPKVLRDIPSDDIETVYATYFNKSILFKKQESESKKIGKKGKKRKEKSPKADKKSKKEKALSRSTSKSEGKIEKEVSVECFDPYAERYSYVSESEIPEKISLTENKTGEIPKEEMRDYKYKQYIIVYSCLSDAVNAIVDTMQSFDCIVTHSTLNEVKSVGHSEDMELKKES